MDWQFPGMPMVPKAFLKIHKPDELGQSHQTQETADDWRIGLHISRGPGSRIS